MNEYAKYVQENLTLRDKLEQVAEEASELSQAALKFIRAYGMSGNPTPITEEQAIRDFREETQDLLCVLRLMFYDSAWKCITDIDNYPKYKRWARRIEDMKKVEKERSRGRDVIGDTRSWKPAFGEKYYTPSINHKGLPFLWNPILWNDAEFDNRLYERGLVCRTKEEAEELAKKILAFVKKVRNDE